MAGGPSPAARSAPRSLAVLPGPGTGPPGFPAFPLGFWEAQPRPEFPYGDALEKKRKKKNNRGAPESKQKGLSQRGAMVRTVLSGSDASRLPFPETKSFLFLPSRPRFWFLSGFLFFFFFFLSLSERLPAFSKLISSIKVAKSDTCIPLNTS